MSGLVNGLQNRLQQFESARHLAESQDFADANPDFFCIDTLRFTRVRAGMILLTPGTRKIFYFPDGNYSVINAQWTKIFKNLTQMAAREKRFLFDF